MFLSTLILIPAFIFNQQEKYYFQIINISKNNFNLGELNEQLPNSGWNRTWGSSTNDHGYSVAVDNNNNAYLCGYTLGFGAGNYDAFLVKYDSAGNQLWNVTWGGSNHDCGYGVTTDSYNTYICGYTGSFGAGSDDAFLAKYDSAGNQLWNVTWGDSSEEYGFDVAVDGYSNVYLCGHTNGFGAGSYDAFLAKYDSAGNQLWNVTWGGSNVEYGYGVDMDSNNNAYLCGKTYSFGAGGWDAFLVKYDSAGNQLWNVTWGGSNDDGSYSVAVDSANGAYLCGETSSFGAGSYDAFLAKYDSAGNQLWNVTWGGSNDDYGKGVTVDRYKKAYICGYTDSYGAGGDDAFLLKYDPAGNKLWTVLWGGPLSDTGCDVAIYHSNNIYLCGDTSSFGLAGGDAFLAKYYSPNSSSSSPFPSSALLIYLISLNNMGLFSPTSIIQLIILSVVVVIIIGVVYFKNKSNK